MLQPGDVVECIEAGPLQRGSPPRPGGPSGLTLGALYTIVAVFPAAALRPASGRTWGVDHVHVREVCHPDPRGAYAARRFRLLKRYDPELMLGLARRPQLTR
jgi:hypothetical protein